MKADIDADCSTGAIGLITPQVPERLMHRWSMGFVGDQLADCRRFSLSCFFQMPPYSTSLPRGEAEDAVRGSHPLPGRVIRRMIPKRGFALATGSTVISRSKVRVEMEPTPLAV